MTDTEILNALQAALDEHFDAGGLGFDASFGRVGFTVYRPVVHNPRSTAPLQSGAFDLRTTLVAALQPHLVRLVTRQLTKK